MPPLDHSAPSTGQDVVDSTACNAYRCILFGIGSPPSASTATTTNTAGVFPRAATTAAAVHGFPNPANWAPWKRNSLIGLAVALLCTFAFLYLIHNHKGIQRIYQFWSSVTPWIVEYKLTKWKAKYVERLDEAALRSRMANFHQKTAPKAIALVQRMGGIYVKMGQILSTVAVGVLDDTYIQALRPLQDGIPPRSLQEMATIFESSTGRKLEDVFEWMEEKPIGAASIGQAHKAVLKKTNGNGSKNKKADVDDVVVVKIQYPEVAELFNADLNNVEIAVRLIAPGSREMVKALRQRHSRELDFREEAQHLRECSDNMARHRLEPQQVRIPKVRNETGLCTQHVLVMEYLQGTTLHAAISQEQDRIAWALGKENGQALREFFVERIGEHLEQTHAPEAASVGGGGGGGWSHIGAGGDADLNGFQRLAMGPVGAAVFRAYVGARNRLDNVKEGFVKVLLPTVYTTDGQEHNQRSRRKGKPINMGKVLKTLFHVHGVQLLRDGVYNADPHPGNVLILQDGRLGLLDYGMVGRVTPQQRKSIAQTILALKNHDKEAVMEIYQQAGYRASWKGGNVTLDANLVHRFATIHFDRFDLSPISVLTKDKVVEERIVGSSGDQNATETDPAKAQLSHHGHHHHPGPRRKTMKLLEILMTTQEYSIPDWIEQGRRLTGLLNGAALQAGWPMSIAKEWHAIAEEVMQEEEEELTNNQEIEK